ncbi:MAG TPA: non-canonical purine NTP pyrophosphatase [Verrucomicrobiae bacterium]|nr:non-canonical purine NTP pyrophosphatase [Verrucomicrobiae bacterium]
MALLVVASRNRHKVGEIQSILGPAFPCLSLEEFPQAPELIEDADTFAGNAMRKALQLAEWLKRSPAARVKSPDLQSFVLADDSGLEVDALNGAPGVYSARFAAKQTGSRGNSSDEANNARLLRLLEGVPQERRTARFRCVLALTPVLEATSESSSRVCYADEVELQTELFEGVCEGCITFAPAGRGGFGYDPLFVPTGHEQSFAELGEDVKNRLSHRANALDKLRRRLSRAA